MELHAVKTFYDDREGLVTIEDDVLSIVRQVRELYGTRIKVSLEPTTNQYVFSERCEDGTERLIFTTDHLDNRDLERLLMADSQSRGYRDTYAQQEREQDELREEQDKSFRERLREQGERLAHAFKREGLDDSYPTQIAVKRSTDG